jgi:CHASE2 domain-containing sensor protein
MSNLSKRNNCNPSDGIGFGMFLVFVGIAALMHQYEYIHLYQDWWQLLALFGLIFGLISILRAKNASQMVSGFFHVALACWFYVSYAKMWGLSFKTSWPFLLIGYGLSQLVVYFLKKPE